MIHDIVEDIAGRTRLGLQAAEPSPTVGKVPIASCLTCASGPPGVRKTFKFEATSAVQVFGISDNQRPKGVGGNASQL